MGEICVVFLLRGLSACRLSWQGSAWVTSPTLERFAARSKVFDNHIASAIDPSDVDHVLFPEELVSALIANGTELIWMSDGVSSCRVGFSHFHCGSTDPLAWAIELSKFIKRNNSLGKLIVIEINQGLPPWKLNKAQCDQFFPYLNKHLSSYSEGKICQFPGIETGDEFVEANPWVGDLPNHVDSVDDLTHLRIIETQAACLYGIDLFVEPMFQVLNSDIGVMVLGDRGLEIGDRTNLGLDNPWPWYSRVHVPCIWHDPRGDLQPQRICSFSQHGDVAETFGKFLLSNFASSQAKFFDLLELAKADTKSCIQRPILSRGLGDCLGIRFGDWSLMNGNNETPKLFKIPQDRWEVLDVASQHLDIVEQMMTCIY